MTYLPAEPRPAAAVAAVIRCIAADCDCDDRGGVIVGYADTQAEAAQFAADNCPNGGDYEVVTD